MLPLGRLGIRAERGEPRDDGLTPAERISLLTLWVIARSPLMIGGDLPTSDPATISLFTKPDVLALHAEATASREVFRENGLVLWTADGPAGVQWAAAFNLHDEPRSLALDARSIGLPLSADGQLRGSVTNVWTGDPLPATAVTRQHDDARGVAPGSVGLQADLDAHGALLIRFDPR